MQNSFCFWAKGFEELRKASNLNIDYEEPLMQQALSCENAELTEVPPNSFKGSCDVFTVYLDGIVVALVDCLGDAS